MAEFTVRVLVRGGINNVPVIADNAVDAQKIGKRHGRVISVKRRSALATVFGAGLTTAERIIFLRRFSTMIRSRVSMSEALSVMARAFRGSIRRVANTLSRKVEAGEELDEAIAGMRKDFPETTAALISSGMRGGDLVSALNNAAEFEAEMDRIRRESSKDLWGAALSFLLAAALIIGTAYWVAPYVLESDLIKAAGDSVNVDWVFLVADITAAIMLIMLTLFCVLLAIAFLLKPVAAAFADRIILKIPIYRDLVLAKNNYTVFYGLGLLVRSGVRIEEALRLSYEAAPAGEVAEDLRRALYAVRAGKPWPDAMRNLHPTDVAALSTSEDREQQGQSLDAVSQHYKELYTQRVQDVVPALKLISAFFLSVGGALIFGMIILPMLQMTNGLL